MLKKSLMICMCFIAILTSGCSLSKKDLIQKNAELEQNIEGLKSSNEDLSKAQKIIDFYNKLTTDTMNSFVLVESKTIIGTNKKYSNGIVIGNVYNTYYALVDYSSIYIENGLYTVMDSYANSYNVNDVYLSDESTGIAILRFNSNSSYIKSVEVGNVSEVYAYLDSMDQLNKVTVLDNIKSSTINYNSTTYNSYYLEGVSLNNGSIFINEENKLMGIYSSKLRVIITKEILVNIIDFI